jgi:hypothetical protein
MDGSFEITELMWTITLPATAAIVHVRHAWKKSACVNPLYSGGLFLSLYALSSCLRFFGADVDDVTLVLIPLPIFGAFIVYLLAFILWFHLGPKPEQLSSTIPKQPPKSPGV